MNKRNYITAALTVVIALSLIIAGVYAFRTKDKSRESGYSEKNKELIGGQKDAYGCLISAGYSWCEAKRKCLRTWEEVCGAEPGENDIGSIRQAFADKYGKDPSEIQIYISHFNGDFARGGVKFAMKGGFGEGGIFLAYKEEGAWRLAFDGNGMISCVEMDKYNFPDDMAFDCYEESAAGSAAPD